MSGMPVDIPTETCDECSFDAARWTLQDAIQTMRLAGELARHHAAGMSDTLWNTRPDPTTWSAAEYVDHVAEIFLLNRLVAEFAAKRPDVTMADLVDPPFAETAPQHDPSAVLAELDRRGSEAATVFSELDDRGLDRAVILEDMRFTGRFAATHVCHDLFHHLLDIARIRRALSDVPPVQHGVVASLHASDGGVPKAVVPEAVVDAGGLLGDRQAARVHHGRPWQALCLYSSDVVDRLASDGHPIVPGAAGENISIAGVDWAQLRAGLELTIGAVRCRLSAPAVPCAKNNQWFSDGTSSHLDHDLHLGQSRWYATVLAGGRIEPGDAVRIEG